MRANWQSLVVVSVVPFVPALAQQVRWQVDGNSAGSVGHAVAGLSDLDGDGAREIAVSTVGGARVLRGSTGAELFFLPIANAAPYNDGIVPADIGDLDGDGVHDIALGSRRDDEVRLFSGADGHLFDEVQGLFSLGADVVSIGDLDGDGLGEILIGADSHPNSASPTGAARIVRASDRSTLMTLTGPASYAAFGVSVAALGDVDSDGLPDFAVGASGMSSSRGTVYAYSGATGTLLWSVSGSANFDAFGFALDRLDDVTGDGRDELVVGAYGAGGTGRVFVLSGVDGAQVRVHSGDVANDRLGFDVAAVGDLDGDGRGDYGAGTWHTADYVRVFSGANGQRIAEFHAPAQFNALALSGCGDLNGNGRADFVVGIEGYYVGGQPFGGVFAVIEPGPDIGFGLGFGDGSGSACPCGNVGAVGEGCRNSTGHGATLGAYGWSSIASTALRFRAEQLPSGVNAVLFSAPNTVRSAGAPFYDGLKLVSSPSRRWGLRAASAAGSAEWQLDSADAAVAGWLPGVNQFFQVWYRDGTGPCGHGSNFTPAERVSFSL